MSKIDRRGLQRTPADHPRQGRKRQEHRKEYVDLVEAGIVDPTKVVRIGLENAVSLASVLLLTEVTMTEVPETKKAQGLEPGMEM